MAHESEATVVAAPAPESKAKGNATFKVTFTAGHTAMVTKAVALAYKAKLERYKAGKYPTCAVSKVEGV